MFKNLSDWRDFIQFFCGTRGDRHAAARTFLCFI